MNFMVQCIYFFNITKVYFLILFSEKSKKTRKYQKCRISNWNYSKNN